MSFYSADTLTYEEKRSCDMHAVTIAAWGGQSIQPGAMSCDPEGRSGALAKLHVWSDVVSVNAPCHNRALPRRRDARMFRVAACPFSWRVVTQSRVDLTARHAELDKPIPGANRCQDSGTLADFPAHDGCARRTPRHPPFGVRDRPS